jgi:hypothetical protein
MEGTISQTEWKRGSAELLILSLVEARPRHGYEISKLIEQRSDVSTLPRFTRCSTAWNDATGFKDGGSKKAGSAAAVIIV